MSEFSTERTQAADPAGEETVRPAVEQAGASTEPAAADATVAQPQAADGGSPAPAAPEQAATAEPASAEVGASEPAAASPEPAAVPTTEAPAHEATSAAATGTEPTVEPAAVPPSPIEGVPAVEAEATPAEAPAAPEPGAPSAAQPEPAATPAPALPAAHPAPPVVQPSPPAPAVAASTTPATTPVPSADDATGQAVARRLEQVASYVGAAFLAKRPIEGKVIGWNKGGFHVSIDGLAAFCPRSLMELGNPRKPTVYLDQTLRFMVTDVDAESRRIVLSRKEILEEERRVRREEVRKKLQLGAVLKGRVESLVDFGAFVDLDGGVKGLVHLSEISRKRVEHPRDALKHGQEIEVKVIRIEKGGDRISLSIRALEPDPWENLGEAYQPGAPFTGKVARHSDFGLFVEVAEGIEGLVHSSQLPLGVEMSDPSVAPGSEIHGWVRELDASRHRLSLTLREIPASDPWRGIQERYQEGQAVRGRVEHASKFGFFVELEPGVTGLLPFSEISTPPGRRKENMYHPGQSVTVQVLQVDHKRRRISLGTEGSKVEGSTADYRAYLKRQQSDSRLNALAAAFEKLRQS